MPQKIKYPLIVLLFILSLLYSFYKYSELNARHDRLITFGNWAKVATTPSTNAGADSFVYEFTTAAGQKIDGNEKCGECYESDYILALYNTKNPEEFEFIGDFANFSPSWHIIFFFILLPIVTTIIAYGFIRIPVYIINVQRGR